MKNTRQKKIYFTVIFIYLLLSVIATYPLVSNFNSAVPGTNAVVNIQDAPTFAWNLWWFKFSLVDLQQNPFITDFILFPQNINLLPHTHTFILGLFSIPLQYFLALPTIINLFFILSLTFSAFGVFLIARYLTGDLKSSFIAGLIFAFSSFIFQHAYLGHLNFYITVFIPYAVLFFIKGINENKYIFSLWGGLFAALTFLNSYQLGYFLFLFLTLLTAYLIFTYRKILKEKLKYFMLFFSVMLLFSSILIMPLIFLYNKSSALFRHKIEQENIEFSAFNFYKPTPQSSLKISATELEKIESAENDIYYGYINIFLILSGLIFLFLKKYKDIKKPGPFLWLILGVVFMVLSFKIYPIFKFLPFYNTVRVLPRFQVMTLFSFSIFSGIALSVIFKTKIFKKNKYLIKILFILMTLIVFAEYLSIPLSLTNLDIHPIYQEIKDDTGDFSLLEIPFGIREGRAEYGFSQDASQYAQTFHHKKILNGFVARLPEDQLFFYNNIPGLKYIAEPEKIRPDKDDLNQVLVKENFKALKIKYIILHKVEGKFVGDENPLSEIYWKEVKKYLEEDLNLKSFYRDTKVVGYLL